MDPQQQSSLYKWLFITWLLLALMALTWSVGSFFVRVFFVASLFTGWKALEIVIGEFKLGNWQSKGGYTGNYRPRSAYTSRPGSEGYNRTEEEPVEAAPISPTNTISFADRLKKIPLAVRIVMVVWIGIFSFIIFIIYMVSSSDDDYGLDSEYYRMIAESFYNQEQYDSAYVYYKAALKADGQSQDALIGYANVLYTKNYPDSTLFYYDKVLELDPYNYDIWYNKAWVYREQKRLTESNDVLDQLLDSNSEYNVAREMMGDNYYDLGNAREARRWYEEAWPNDQDNVNLNTRLAELVPGPEGDKYRGKSNQ